MPLEKLPTASLDDPNHRRRARETLNKVLDHTFDDSKAKSAQEFSDGAVVINQAYKPGDPRRYNTSVTVNENELEGYFDFGDVPTYVDATHFTVPNNRTSRYTPFTRLIGIGSGTTRADIRVVSSTFGANTSVTITTNDVGGSLPNPLLAVLVQIGTSARGVGNIRFNSNTIAGLEVINAASGSTTASRFCARTLDSSGVTESAVCLVAVSPSYSGAYLSGGFSSGARGVLYTPPTMSLEIGTSDAARITIPNDGTAIGFASDISVSISGAAATIAVGGSTSGRLSLRATSAENGYMFANASEVQIGSTPNIDVSIIQNAGRVLTFRGGNTTGATAPALTANKPGAGTAIIEWVAVKTSAGTNGWQPIWAN